VVEDVLDKVDKFISPVDFVVMDMEDEKVLLIPGTPFMKTVIIIVDVDEGKLKAKAQDDEVTFYLFDGLKNSNAWKKCLQRDTTKEVFLDTKEQLDLSNLFEKDIHHYITKTKEEDKVQQEVTIEKDEYRPGQPIMLREVKLQIGLKKKGSRLWLIKELKIDGTIELESPYSRMTKVVTRKLLQQKGHSP